jgi:hypothetical protein
MSDESTRRQNPEERHNPHRRENFKSHNKPISWVEIVKHHILWLVHCLVTSSVLSNSVEQSPLTEASTCSASEHLPAFC